ncbi:DUF99 family protein [Halorarum halophilum]|uniref:DUF99 family protein n=1 Tax=Halorarum halophilum TaxID=2743090 RepID=A0A7D5GGH6_9EURY|nr:DUF99 family protein [Halobaculum halophilum]QLG29108.1 DUF99 family protein [Halobaculum halophilum]
MKAGARALGMAVSTPPGETPTAATVAGALVRADRTFDGLAFSTCTVGATDYTDSVIHCVESLDREDVQYLLAAGIAPAWFNVLDLLRVHESVGRPVLSVSFEASTGLETALREQFSGDALAERLAIYERQPSRVPVEGMDAWVRAVGVDDNEAADVVRELTPEGGRRPEPLRVARIAARAGRSLRDDGSSVSRGVGGSHDDRRDDRET